MDCSVSTAYTTALELQLIISIFCRANKSMVRKMPLKVCIIGINAHALNDSLAA